MNDPVWKPLSEMPPSGASRVLVCKVILGQSYFDYCASITVERCCDLHPDSVGYTHFAYVPEPPVVLTELQQKEIEINKLKELLHFFAYPGEYFGREKMEDVMQRTRDLLKNHTT